MIALTFGIALLNGAVSWLYFALFESSVSGATIGKRVCGIRVVDLKGERVSFGRATGRYFASMLSSLTISIGFIMCAFTEKKQTLHDMIAGTLCIKT